jgi:hypothetical protein
MTNVYLICLISIGINAAAIWYVIRLLRKFMFISESLSDLYFTTKAFQIFVTSVYGMDAYHGEPIIQELVMKIQDVSEEMENFREIFEYTLDEELEEELNAVEESAQETRPQQK